MSTSSEALTLETLDLTTVWCRHVLLPDCSGSWLHSKFSHNFNKFLNQQGQKVKSGKVVPVTGSGGPYIPHNRLTGAGEVDTLSSLTGLLVVLCSADDSV